MAICTLDLAVLHVKGVSSALGREEVNFQGPPTSLPLPPPPQTRRLLINSGGENSMF